MLECMAPVGEPVQERGSQGRIPEDLHPARELQVGCDNKTPRKVHLVPTLGITGAGVSLYCRILSYTVNLYL